MEEPRTKDARERALKKVEGALLTEFALETHVRQTVERLGTYQGAICWA
jgi:hypothetical protein